MQPYVKNAIIIYCFLLYKERRLHIDISNLLKVIIFKP